MVRQVATAGGVPPIRALHWRMLRTTRLRIRPLGTADVPSLHALLTDADFVRFVGDRGIRTDADAAAYLADGPLATYAAHGYGMWAVETLDGAWAGIAGLVRRSWLDAPDLGYAFMPPFRGRGLAREAAAAVRGYAHGPLAIPRLLAIVAPHHAASIAVLEAIGFTRIADVTPPGASAALACFASEAVPGATGAETREA